MDKLDVSQINEIPIKDILFKIKAWLLYIKGKWIYILISAIVGGILGFGYAIRIKPNYKAVCTFVLEDAKGGGSGIGQYAGLASLAGINLGESGGGIFEGDNIIELYKSRSMLKKALLSTCIINNKKQLLIDRYIDYNDLRSKKENDGKIPHVSFNADLDNFNRMQDSIITYLVNIFNEKILNVTKPDKKLNIINVEVNSKDEIFSKYFTDNIVQTVNDFYIETKTKKEHQNVQILQHQADSLRMVLNNYINGVASATDANPNANTFLSVLKVASQKKQIDVQASSAIYSEIVKNLELAKISLRQETPLIQVIDKPVFPLPVERTSILKATILGIVVFLIFAVLFFISKKIFSNWL